MRPDFWDRLTAMGESEDMAERMVAEIMCDVTDRRGWRQAFDEFDEDIRHEILDTWLRIVRDGLKARP